MYDPVSETAFVGPGWVQAPPSNTLPKLNFEKDSDDFLWIMPPKWGVNDNGVIGYGRFPK